MKKGKGVILGVLLALILSPLTFASESDMVKLQGVVMTVDLKNNSFVVNEKLIVWNPRTTIHDDKGSAVTFEQLKPKNWVYIEGIRDRARGRTLATKIYLVPKRIDEKEKHLYPFMQQEEKP